MRSRYLLTPETTDERQLGSRLKLMRYTKTQPAPAKSNVTTDFTDDTDKIPSVLSAV